MLERRAMDLLNTRRPRTLLIAFCLLLWLPGLFTLPPTDRDESRFAQASKQMIETGDYVRIMNGDEARNRKPIGIHWLQVPFAAAARAAGLAHDNPVWPYRLPSLLGGLAGVLAVERWGRALVGRRAALLGAGMLAACVLLVTEVHLAKTDAALLGATTVCMGLLGTAYIRPERLRWWEAAGFWLAMGAGVLLKGPITPLVAGLAAGILAVCDRRAGWMRGLRPGWGVPLMALVVLPWFAAIGLATHGAFFSDAVGGDLGRKLAGGDDAHGGPPGLHLLLLPLLAFPLTTPALLAVPAAWGRRAEPGVRYLLAWVIPAWLVFEAVPTKLPHYTLPLYPAICLLAAQFVLGGPAGPPWWRAVGHGVHWAAGAVLAVGALALPAVLGMGVWPGVPAAAAVALATWLGTRTGGTVLALAAMPMMTLALIGWELPRAQALWIAPRVEQLLVSEGAGGGRVGAVGFHEPSLMLLAGTSTALPATAAEGARALADGTIDRLLVLDRDLPAFEQSARALGLAYAASGTVRGFNYSRGRWVTLILFRKA